MSKVVFTVDEKFNMEAARALHDSLPPDHYDKARVAHIVSNADEEGRVTVSYTRRSDINFGRCSSSAIGYQNMSTITRVKLGSDIYHDYDMVNAYPNILRQISNKYEIQCPELEYYCANRDSVINEIMKEHPFLDRDEVKKIFIVQMHGGLYKNHLPERVTIRRFESFGREIVKIAKSLLKLPKYSDMYKLAISRGKTNPLGSTISWACQDAEYQIVEAFFHDCKGLGPYMFDGRMIERQISQEELLQRAEFAFQKTGFRVQFIEKPMVMPDVALQFRHRPQVQGERVIAFDVRGTLMNKHSFRPGVERLKELVDAGFTLSLFSNGSVHNIPVEALESRAGVKFASVLGGESCYKPSEAYLNANTTLDKHDKIKPLAKYFTLDSFKLVDDTPQKVHSTERHRVISISTYKGGRDSHLSMIIDSILAGSFEQAQPLVDTNEPRSSLWGPEVDYKLHTSDYVLPSVLDCPQKVCCIAAGYGRGKTTATISYLRDLQDKAPLILDRPLRILCVTPKCSLGYGLYKKYSDELGDMSHYMDSNLTRNEDKVIVQYESLHHYNKAEPYDIIVLDELRELVGSMTSIPTNGDNLNTNLKLLELFMKSAQKVIVTDDDLESDGAVAAYLQAIFDQSEISVNRFSVKGTRSIRFTTSQTLFHSEVVAALADKKGIVPIACQYKKSAEAWSKTFPDNVVKTMTGSSSDGEKREMSDINEALEGTELFVFSPTITVGVDHTRQTNKVFIDATGSSLRGCPARTLFQMAGRFRNFSDKEIVVLIPDGPHIDTPRAYRDALDKITANKNRIESHKSLFESDPSFVDGLITYTPTHIAQLFAFSEAERMRDHVFVMENLAVKKGWTVTRDCAQPAELPSHAVSVEEVKKDSLQREKEAHAKVVAAMNESRLDALIDNCHDSIRTKTATEENRNIAEFGAVMRNYAPDMSFDDATFARDHKKQINNWLEMSRLGMQAIVHKDLCSMAHGLADVRNNPRSISHYALYELWTTLGFDGAMDETTVVPVEVFESNAAAIQKICDQTPGERAARATRPNARVNSKLKDMLGISLQRVRTQVNGVRTTGYKQVRDKRITDLVHRSTKYNNIDPDGVKSIPQVVEVKVRKREHAGLTMKPAEYYKRAKTIGMNPVQLNTLRRVNGVPMIDDGQTPITTHLQPTQVCA